MRNIQFEIDILEVPRIFDSLKVIEGENENFLSGTLKIVDDDNKLWDSYDIEIHSSDKYPNAFPKLFETSNSFPKNADWHVYESDMSCCVDIPPNEILICKNGFKVADYISQFAIPYFANQTFRKREGYYHFGEYSHGYLGKLEFYQSKLKAKSLKELLEMFALIVKDYSPDRRALCPFCHKSKFRKCHKNVFKELGSIKSSLILDGEIFMKIYRINPNFKLPKG